MKHTPALETYLGTRNTPRHAKHTTPHETHPATRNAPRHAARIPAGEVCAEASLQRLS
jgi:hypothetical protein